jgi:outer membrane protein
MIMKNLLKITVICVLLLSAPAVNAQTSKFGYISTSQLLRIMPEGAAADNQLRLEIQNLQKELETLNTEYRNKFTKYLEEQETMSNSVRQLRERELTELQNRIQEFEAGAQEDLQQRRVELLQPIFAKIENVINEVARERGYTFVFDLDINSILYFSDETEDILPFIKEKLNL